MNDLANTTQTGLSTIDDLATQAQMFSCGAAMNLLQLGRVLTEAKPLVPHGEWTNWVKTNAHMPVRRAQEYMQCYKRFGIDQRIAQLGTSQIVALLPMSDDEREELMAEHDVSSMTTREIDEAIHAQRERLREEAMAEAQAAIDEAERRAEQAERRAEEMAGREPEIPKELTDELNRNRQEITRLAQANKDALADALKLRRENAQLESDMKEQEAILQEQQEAMNRAQEELLNIKSAQARGDVARPAADELTPDVLSQAVREFIGACARMPYMAATFSTMSQAEKAGYAESLHMLEDWIGGARQALESCAVEGGFVLD